MCAWTHTLPAVGKFSHRICHDPGIQFGDSYGGLLPFVLPHAPVATRLAAIKSRTADNQHCHFIYHWTVFNFIR